MRGTGRRGRNLAGTTFVLAAIVSAVCLVMVRDLVRLHAGYDAAVIEAARSDHIAEAGLRWLAADLASGGASLADPRGELALGGGYLTYSVEEVGPRTYAALVRGFCPHGEDWQVTALRAHLALRPPGDKAALPFVLANVRRSPTEVGDPPPAARAASAAPLTPPLVGGLDPRLVQFLLALLAVGSVIGLFRTLPRPEEQRRTVRVDTQDFSPLKGNTRRVGTERWRDERLQRADDLVAPAEPAAAAPAAATEGNGGDPMLRRAEQWTQKLSIAILAKSLKGDAPESEDEDADDESQPPYARQRLRALLDGPSASS